MTTWLYPPAFAETFRCDYCECDFDEDDLTEYERNKWACDECTRANDEDAAAMQEMADDHRVYSKGMSLRDWFAGQALAGWMASFPPCGEGVVPGACARLAYDLADAMLDARAKGGDT